MCAAHSKEKVCIDAMGCGGVGAAKHFVICIGYLGPVGIGILHGFLAS